MIRTRLLISLFLDNQEGESARLRCNISPTFSPAQNSVKRLHTSMKPLHTILANTLKLRNFAPVVQHFNLSYMTKADLEKKKSLARSLYLAGMEQTEISDKVGVSRVTVSKWCTAEGWKEARAAKQVSRPELVNKLLLTIDTLIEQVHQSEDPTMIAGLGDKLAKLSSVIEKLDKKANVVDAIEVFMAFSRWLEYRSQTDPEITPELLKAINKYQDKYLIESMSANSLK